MFHVLGSRVDAPSGWAVWRIASTASAFDKGFTMASSVTGVPAAKMWRVGGWVLYHPPIATEQVDLHPLEIYAPRPC